MSLPQDLKDVKPPVDFPVQYWPIILCVVLVLSGIISFLAYYFIKKSRQKKPLSVTKLPWDAALEKLEALKKENFLSQGKFKEFYTDLSDVIRWYMEERFNIRAPEMTTQEFLWSLENSSQLPEGHKSFLKDFLTSCDMVKFAQYGPAPYEAEESLRLAYRLVEETKEVLTDLPAGRQEDKT